MRLLFTAAALLCSIPALATGGLLCKPVNGKGPALSLVIPHGPWGISGASLDEGRGWRSSGKLEHQLILSQGWIDRERVWVDLADGRTLERFAALRARMSGHEALGTLTLRGRVWRVRCVDN